MKSLRELYRIGHGPSSSHTMGPRMAAERFAARTESAVSYRITLFGSLAATGKGHMTDRSVSEALYPKSTEFLWKSGEFLPYHANAMAICALDKAGGTVEEALFYSVGGGAIQEDGAIGDTPELYPNLGMTSFIEWSRRNARPLWELVFEKEDKDIQVYLSDVWDVMQDAVQRGLEYEGVLPGELKLDRKAHGFFQKSRRSDPVFQRSGLLYAYALAVSEENASLGKVVTAPTCGSAGVMPSVLKYLKELLDLPDDEVIKALATASLIGNIVKTRATISGAAGGCQAEVGTACAMAAAAAVQMMGGTPQQIEYAAEMGLEHHLGLTCDPVKGLVQIPCIERNAVAATRAFACAEYSMLSDGDHRISFDEVVETMRQTGLDMNSRYRETSAGGLAKHTKVSRQSDTDIVEAPNDI
jgi:L-serine dehydratase